MQSAEVGKTDLKALDMAGLEECVASLGWEKYRARQLFTWIWQKGVSDFRAMTNLAQAKRELLSGKAIIGGLRQLDVRRAQDGTAKFLFALADGLRVESVFIPDAERRTVCVSSQVGCVLACDFCLTGGHGFKRNLEFHEIADQALQVGMFTAARDGGQVRVAEASRGGHSRSGNVPESPRSSRAEELMGQSPTPALTNVVMMGMGEPMLNLDAVLKAAEVMNSDLGLKLGARRITISTAGIPDGIRCLAEYPKQFKLAVSLNATDDATRSRLMPINRKYPLAELFAAIRYYAEKTRKRTTFEYVLIAGQNDTHADALRLVKMLKFIPCKINLIPFNSCPGRDYRSPTPETVQAFAQLLYPHLPAVTIRASKGREIMAACGQLAGTANS